MRPLPLHQSAAQRLQARGLEPTPLRLAVLGRLLACPTPLSAPELLAQIQAERPINKVTLYRILDLLVTEELVLRHSAGERALRYCASGHGEGSGQDPQALGPPPLHCHFHCTRCGGMQCLPPPEPCPDLGPLTRSAAGSVQRVEIRLDGLCASCRAQAPDLSPAAAP